MSTTLRTDSPDRRGFGPALGSADPEDTDAVEITIPEGGELITPFHVLEASTFTIYLARGAGPWIRSLLARGVEVVWATTWMQHANVHLAPLLRIPELPVAVVLDEFTYLHRGDSAAWKLEQLARGFRGRPLVWVDDNPPWPGGLTALEDARARRRDGGVSLMVQPDTYTGITAEDMARVDAWLELVSTAEGRAEVRAARKQRSARKDSTDA